MYINHKSVTLALVVLALAGTARLLPARAQEVVHLQWQPSGIHTKVSGMRPHVMPLSKEKPEGLQKAPAGITNALYGRIELGPPKKPVTCLVIAEFHGHDAPRVFLDGNANGDLTDDPACTSESHTYTRPDGSDATTWTTTGTLRLSYAGQTREGAVKFYAAEARTADGRTAALYYFTDYGLVGEATIDGQKVPVALDDAGATGNFLVGYDGYSNPGFWVGATNPATRRYGIGVSAGRPFEFNGKWWATTNITLDGTLQVVAAQKPELPKKVVDLAVGAQAPAFTKTLLGGKTVRFPADYKGKVVLMDFWATWCGPCVAEIPNVVKAYGKYHDQGFEVLGISLDKEDWEAKLAAFTKKKEMPWPQVYEGKYWQSDLVKPYAVSGIPHMLLVDGDTGKILANKTIRGENLAPAIEKALADRKK